MGVMIDSKLWDMLKAYFLYGMHDASLCNDIRLKIADKVSAQQKRETFSAYKQAPSGSSEREQLRQDYLDSVGVMSSFRSDSEYHEEQPPF